MADIKALANRSRLIGLSLARAVARGDYPQISNWAQKQAAASMALAVAVDPSLAEPEIEPDTPPVYDHVLTYDEEHVIFVDAEDEILKSLGRPYGHDGAERGALPLTVHIDLAKKLNLPLHVAEFESFVQPGTEQ
jgi:hypothetical protein